MTVARVEHRRRPLGDPHLVGAEIKRAERFMSLAGELVRIETRAAAAEREAAQLARVRASRSDLGIQDLRDLGPAIRRARGDTEADDRTDKDGVPIGGARASDPIATLLARKLIDRDQAQAAERLRSDVEISAGHVAASNMDRISAGSRGARWPADDVLDASARVRAVVRDLAPELLEVCEAVILRRQPICRFAATIGRRRQAASALVEAALDALVLHYGLGRREAGDLRRLGART